MDLTIKDLRAVNAFREKLSNTACHRCGLYQMLAPKGYFPVVSKGNGRIMLVGLAPGSDEHINGEPFSGGFGSIIRSEFQKGVGLNTDLDCYMTNMVKCHPDGFDKFSGDQRKNCSIHFAQELQLVDPEIVIFFNKDLFKIVGYEEDIVLGEPFKAPLFGKTYWVYIMNNPGGLVRDASQYKPFRAQLRILAQWFDRELDYYAKKGIPKPVIAKMAEREYTLVDTKEKANEMVMAFKKYITETGDSLIALDTETTGVNLFAPDFAIIGVSLSVDDKHGYYLPIGHRNKPRSLVVTPIVQMSLDSVRHLLIYLIENVASGFVFHNLAYDYRVLKRMKLDFSKTNVHDTMILAYLFNENDRIGLKDQSFINFNYKALEFKNVAEGYKFQYVPLDLATKYAGDDAINTKMLYNKFSKDLPRIYGPESGLLNRIYPSELTIAKIMADAQDLGMMLDIKYLQHLEKRLTTEARELHAKMDVICNAIDHTSTYQLSHLMDDLFKSAGDRFDFEDQYGWAADENHLKMLRDYVKKAAGGSFKWTAEKLEEYVELLLVYRRTSKMLSTYVSLKDKVVLDSEGLPILHGEFKTVGTTSGRMSSNNPNLQNLPREAIKAPKSCFYCGKEASSYTRATDGVEVTEEWYDKVDETGGIFTCSSCKKETSSYMADIRKAFIARPGRCFVAADYDSMEMAVAAAVSGDETLVGIIKGKAVEPDNPDYDMHRVTAASIYDCEPAEVNSEQRQNTKAVNFGCLASGTKVQVKDKGWVPIELVNEGDFIKTPTGYTKVHHHLDQGVKAVYLLKDSYGKSILATENHRFSVLDTEKHELIWKRLDELKQGDYLVKQIMDSTDTGIVGKDADLLREFKDGNLYVSRFVSADYIGDRQTWDVTIDAPHAFNAEGYIVHNSLYGISEIGLQATLRGYGITVTVDEARKMLEGFFIAYPGIKTWFTECRRKLQRDHYIDHPYGRRRHVAPNPSPEDVRSATNFIIQGWCASITKEAIVEVNKAFEDDPEINIVTVIHDEIVVECPIDKVSQVAAVMNKAMNITIKDKAEVQLTAEPEVKFNLSKAAETYTVDEFVKKFAA
ncbi:DNA polymerase [Acinetobacter sp.]|uniref:DNA polymerase n=1 Tax=Acinetobacter sp. TaxID=472 RepID=UPI003D081A16